MCYEVSASLLKITLTHIATILAVILAGPAYNYAVYQDNTTAEHCLIGNALAFATYLGLGSLVACITGYCYMICKNSAQTRRTRFFNLSDIIISLCSLGMGAGYAGAIYPENSTNFKCLVGNALSWVTMLLIVSSVAVYVHCKTRSVNDIVPHTFLRQATYAGTYEPTYAAMPNANTYPNEQRVYNSV